LQTPPSHSDADLQPPPPPWLLPPPPWLLVLVLVEVALDAPPDPDVLPSPPPHAAKSAAGSAAESEKTNRARSLRMVR
jgi:hypothetical protein